MWEFLRCVLGFLSIWINWLGNQVCISFGKSYILSEQISRKKSFTVAIFCPVMWLQQFLFFSDWYKYKSMLPPTWSLHHPVYCFLLLLFLLLQQTFLWFNIVLYYSQGLFTGLFKAYICQSCMSLFPCTNNIRMSFVFYASDKHGSLGADIIVMFWIPSISFAIKFVKRIWSNTIHLNKILVIINDQNSRTHCDL